MKENRVLTIDNLTTTFESHKQKIQAVRGVSLHVDEGDILAIVGESGSGKSVTMKSVMGLLGENADVQADHLELLQKDLLSMSEKEKRKMRGKDMAMIFQDPMTALNPLKKIGYHMIDVLRRYQNLSKAEARKVAIDMLGKVGIPSAESRMDQYPHEFSGGMRQRVMIAMALCCQPRLLIADEPTTALDVTIQAHSDHPRSRGGSLSGETDRSDVRRSDHGRGNHRRDLRTSDPSVHESTASCDSKM